MATRTLHHHLDLLRAAPRALDTTWSRCRRSGELVFVERLDGVDALPRQFVVDGDRWLR